jgi:AraC-like DNA-binding protein
VTVVAMLRDPLARARVVDAVRDRGAVIFCRTAAEVRRHTGVAGVRAVITSPLDCTGTAMAPVIREIRDGLPSVPVLAYCTVGASLSHDIVELVRSGVHELVILDVDDTPPRLRAMLVRARCTCRAAGTMGQLATLVPLPLRPALEYCLGNADREIAVEEIARVLGIHRKTLVNRCRLAGLPTPSSMIGWCRLLVAAQLLEDRDRKLEHVALELGFPSSAAMRARFRHYLGLTPGEVRENGGTRCVLHAFREQLAMAQRQRTDRLEGRPSAR